MAGATIGALVSGPVMDKIGRKPAVLICSCLFTLSSIGMALAQSYAVLLIGRFVVGLAVGASGIVVSGMQAMLTSMTATYSPIIVLMTEISTPKLRGVLVAVNEVAICCGCLVALGIDAAFTDVEYGWRFMLGFSGIPAVLQLFGMSVHCSMCIWIPECAEAASRGE